MVILNAAKVEIPYQNTWNDKCTGTLASHICNNLWRCDEHGRFVVKYNFEFDHERKIICATNNFSLVIKFD